MSLSSDEHELLRWIAASPVPVVVSDYFPAMNPSPPGLDEHHPDHEPWMRRQDALYEVMVSLYQQELVRVVDPADGSRPDLAEVTEAGRSALSLKAP